MKTLAIETSCDDTSLAIVSWEDGCFVVEKLLSYTQTKEHAARGGVVPELAARSHADKIGVVLEELGGAALANEIETISVTSHPGLPGALVVGITTAYTLSKLRNKPVIEVNHIMGHVFSILAERKLSILQLPYVCLTVSGGHNDLYLVEALTPALSQPFASLTGRGSITSVNNVGNVGHVKHHHMGVGESLDVGSFVVTKLGQTIDDAAGEVFDKVARMLGGPYPGGKRIGEQAMMRTGGIEELRNDTGRDAISARPDGSPMFHAAKLPDQPLNFSFSGMKSQAQKKIEEMKNDTGKDAVSASPEIARAFQEAASDILVEKLTKAVEQYDAKTVGVVGGVSANLRLREKIAEDELLSQRKVYLPEKFVYCTDNAAMIGVVGLIMAMKN